MAELHLDALVAMAPAAVLDTTEFADPWFRDFARVGASEAARWLAQGPAYFTDGGEIPTGIDVTHPAAALSYALDGYLSDFSVPEDAAPTSRSTSATASVVASGGCSIAHSIP